MGWWCLVAGLVGSCMLAPFARADLAGASTAPFYTSASIVNAATQTASGLAPNVIATIYGTNLSWTTKALSGANTNGGEMPTILDTVRVLVNGYSVGLFYVSPTQINFIIPYEAPVGKASVIVLRQGIYGPTVSIPINDVAPGFFAWDKGLAIATHADGSLITGDSPASAGEIIVLYATGLGGTAPAGVSLRIPTTAAVIVRSRDLRVSFDDTPCEARDVLYAGVTPFFAGLYQINVRVPQDVGPHPQLKIVIGSSSSPAAQLAAVR